MSRAACRAGSGISQLPRESAVKTVPRDHLRPTHLPCVEHGICWSRSHRLAARELKREAAQAQRSCRASQGHITLRLESN